jgi:ribosome-associated translation inhibitor RaiA
MTHAELTFHGLDHSDRAEAAVLRWIARIEQLHDGVTRFGVVIDHDWPHTFEVHVTIEDPEIGVESHAKHENIYIAIADAFRATHRQLQGEVLKRAS